jgi:tetratricopeptide (TPR) repeat protein
MDGAEAFERARNDAEQAIALEPNLAHGHLALATVLTYYAWQWQDAEAHLQKAAKVEPDSADVLSSQALLSQTLGRLDEAVELYRRAAVLDPLRATTQLSYGVALYCDGRYEEAKSVLEKALELNPQAAVVHGVLAQILLSRKLPQEALKESEQEPLGWGRLTGEAMAYHSLHRPEDSEAALQKLIATYQKDAAYQIAEVYAYRGESDEAFEWLDRAYQNRDPGLPGLKTDPAFKSLREDTRFTSLLKRMNLPV